MPKYRVYMAAVAEHSVEVEADDPEDAIEKAYESPTFPYFPGGMEGDLGDWTTLSDLFPDRREELDDYELIEE